MLLESDYKKFMTEYAVRRIMWITPCKRSAARGRKQSLTFQQLRQELNYYVVQKETDVLAYPELRFACTGLSMFKTYGLLVLKNINTKYVHFNMK